MRLVEMYGSPRERGRQHGETLRDVIRNRSIPGLVADKPQTIPEFDAQTRRLTETLQRSYPAAVEEIEGIAEGADIDREQALQLNLYYCYRQQVGQCTYVGFQCADGSAVLGKNEDASPRELLVMFKASRDDSSSHLFATYAGVVSLSCGNGLNSAGLAVVGTSIGALNIDYGCRELPVYFMVKQMLETCESVEDCRRFIRDTPFSLATHVGLADAGGELLGVELISDRDDVYHYPDNGAIYRSNHPVLPQFAPLIDDSPANQPGLLNSRKRIETLDQLTAELPHDVTGLQTILRSHHPHTSICQHYQTNGAVMNTDGSFMMIPRERKILGLIGHACQNAYEEFSL